jgi:hypothetical protein
MTTYPADFGKSSLEFPSVNSMAKARDVKVIARIGTGNRMTITISEGI